MKNLDIDFAAIKEEAAALAFEPPLPSAFAVKHANAWSDEAKNQAIPNKLFDEFWYESELCFLFADTNAGKSILAVQITELIASGKSESAPQKILYYRQNNSSADILPTTRIILNFTKTLTASKRY